MQRNSNDNHSPLTQAIRRHAHSEALRSYAASLPQFKVSNDLPDRFLDMLVEIEAAEVARRRS
ncbi:MAG TPA: hypothetical protein VIU14_01760 [Mesorhizobium sp.]|jgi:hypothetical protein